MDLSGLLRRCAPAAAALTLFFVVSAAYFAPQFRGEVLPQHDTMQFEGMARDIRQMRADTGEDPQWTGGMFGGMPAYLISVLYPTQLVMRTVGAAVQHVIDTPTAFLFFAMVSMWLALLLCGVDPWLAIVPATAYGFSTYFPLIIGAGHVTKMWAMVYAPLLMGGAWMTLRGNRWYGAALTALAASLEIGANHPQITYYFLMALAAFWISEAVVALRSRRTADFLRRTALLAAAGVLALLSNFAPLWYTARHTADTIRGGSELALAADGTAAKGLALDYATAWSYGRAESWNLLVPDFAGRDSGMTFARDGEVAATLGEMGLEGLADRLPAYWGGQPYTAGPTYLGAAAIFLALLGVLLASDRNRWWVVAVSLLMLLLAWGRNLMGFTEFFFDYLPGYNKFRTVSMTLVVVQWAIPFLGALGLCALAREASAEAPARRTLLRAVAWAGGITGGLCLLLALFGRSLFAFGEAEASALLTDYMRRLFEANGLQEYIARGMDIEWGERIGAAMADERCALMQADAWRSLGMIVLAAGAVLLYAFRRMGRIALAGVLAAVMLLDLVPVDQRFLSHDDFGSPARQRITASEADRTILQDKTPGFRVLNLTVSPFNDATTSYFHRSVGGYHGAKLARYQDLIDRYLADADEAVLDMLDTRYVIVPDAAGRPEALLRESAFGPAWFVGEVRFAPTAEAELDLLGTVDLQTTAVVAGADSDRIATPLVDSATLAAARIELTEYRPHRLRYTYDSPADAVAVFSEIFYDKGWTARIDGVEAPAFRADYVLRAMQLPAGRHTVVWTFRAPGWGLASAITLVASLAILLGALAAAAVWLKRQRR